MDTGDDQYLIERIHEALATDPRVNELELEVSVAAGRVYVTGTVASQERQEAVADVVAELAPDRDVHNQTTVVHLSSEPEVEKLA